MADSERRRLGTPSLGAIVVANMVGAGVFTTSGFALGDLGSPGRVMAAWVTGGVIAILGAVCYGALAARLSKSGGEYLFLSRTLHSGAGFLAGWVSLWAGFTGAIAFAAEATQVYLAPWIPDTVPLDVVGSAAIVLAGLLHTAGVGPGAVVQNIVVAGKIALLVALVVLGLQGLPGTTEVATPPEFSVGAFTVAVMWISLSYSGWNAAVYVGGEAREPTRSLPRALLGGTLLVTVLYLTLNWVFVHAAPIDQLAFQEDVAAIAAGALGGAALETLVRVVIVVALVTSISSMVMIGPRVVAQMASDGLFPRRLAFSGDVPAAAIWLQVALAVGILWASGLRQQLTNLGWILSLFTALTVVGLLRLRHKEGAERVPVPGYPIVPVLFLVLVFALTGTTLVVSGSQLAPAVVTIVTGAGAYFVFRRRAPQSSAESG